MRVGTPGFIPGRLTEARWARRIPSMAALARLLGIAPSTVMRWEDGTSAPDAESLSNLANLFRVRQEYFLRPVYADGNPMFLRSLADTYVRDLDYQRAQMHWLQEISHVVEHYVDFPAVDIPDVLAGAHYRQLEDDDIERIALELRQHWGIGDGPCTDVVGLMERVGFIVSVIEMGTIKLDGLCSWSPVDKRPHVLVATDKNSFPRRQFDAAHEMAHGILHARVTAEEYEKDWKTIESQAFRLASAFLMPSTTYPLESRIPSLANFVTLKERWRVSIKAQIKRLSDLGIIDDYFSKHLYKLYSAKGWSRKEPLDDQWAPVEPRILREALCLIVDEGVRTKADLLGLEFTVSAGDIENLTGLPNGWFSHKDAEIVSLKNRQAEPSRKANQGEAEILHFPPRS